MQPRRVTARASPRPPPPDSEGASAQPHLSKAPPGPAPEAANFLRRHDATIKDMANSGSTYEAIADATGLSSGYVRMRAKELGCSLRASGPAKGTLCRPEPTAAPQPSADSKEGLSGSHLRALIELKKLGGAVFSAADLKRIMPGCDAAANAILSALCRAKHIERVDFGRYQIPGAKGFDAKSSEAQDMIERHIASKGVSTQPDFGDKTINELYSALIIRGHSLCKTANKKFFLGDGYKQMSRADTITWMREIIARERPVKEIAGARGAA